MVACEVPFKLGGAAGHPCLHTVDGFVSQLRRKTSTKPLKYCLHSLNGSRRQYAPDITVMLPCVHVVRASLRVKSSTQWRVLLNTCCLGVGFQISEI